MAPSSLPSFLFSFLLLSTYALAVETGQIGINYGRIANNLPTPDKVVQLLKQQGITRVKLYDSDASVLKAFSGSKIAVTVALPNEKLAEAAGSQSFTDSWVQTNILPYHPSSNIIAIAVGNEANADSKVTSYVVPAMNNVYATLQKNSLANDIKISSPISYSVLQSSYPASSGSFKQELMDPFIKPMLEFLKKTKSYMMVNAYPFFAYSANSGDISLDYALFRPNSGNVDSGNGLKYNSLFEAQLDAVYAAMDALKFNDLKIVVTETGWPSKGDENEIGASSQNAAAYNGNLIKRVLTGGGTPLRPKIPLDVYLFALFNENQKPGPTSERNYGLFYPTEQKVYDVPLTASKAAAAAPAVGAVAPATGAVAPEAGAAAPATKAVAPVGGAVAPAAANNAGKTVVPKEGQSWCVANEAAEAKKLQAGLDWACGQGKADCRPIQPGATCYNPGNLNAHASYAFNSYYQMKTRAAGTCDFGGAAHVVTQAPKFGSCEFPTGY
ncbi:glucan endo-1,3-beta-glucosidase 14-like [Chenopodium quinoa]|uniref:glucan endo-1,3-beta-glucosidase 14-like n=1 Tax=Chenopodium quinoa TaxID=63459 RepID=UPI000B78D4E8|nr:glucan endo-1,3-beta-glucosidase 14-like [Chenopodium quinoa]